MYVQIVTPLTLYLHPKLVFGELQLWRLVTNCLYLGNPDFRLFLRLYGIVECCKMLEEKSFRGRSADFFYMMLFGVMVLTGIVLGGRIVPSVSASFAGIYYLSDSLVIMMVYLWSKYNPSIPIGFILFTCTSAYLPWVLLGISIFVGASPLVELLGIVAGHAYYFLEDIYPRMTGRRPLKTPAFIKAWFADDEFMRPATHVRLAPPAPQDELIRDE
uniref:Derlin n=1 Tax=Kalanchoe fedtschenkoi TaxID=63787 RepID=A0A7N0RF29_KALFE